MPWRGVPAEPTSALTPMSTSTPCSAPAWLLAPVLMWPLQLSGAWSFFPHFTSVTWGLPSLRLQLCQDDCFLAKYPPASAASSSIFLCCNPSCKVLLICVWAGHIQQAKEWTCCLCFCLVAICWELSGLCMSVVQARGIYRSGHRAPSWAPC